MSGLAGVLRELFGLFVDDGAMALALIAIIALAAAAAALMPGTLTAGAVLLLGCIGVLVVNVVVVARR
jgi:hypothetical protein